MLVEPVKNQGRKLVPRVSHRGNKPVPFGEYIPLLLDSPSEIIEMFMSQFTSQLKFLFSNAVRGKNSQMILENTRIDTMNKIHSSLKTYPRLHSARASNSSFPSCPS